MDNDKIHPEMERGVFGSQEFDPYLSPVRQFTEEDIREVVRHYWESIEGLGDDVLAPTSLAERLGVVEVLEPVIELLGQKRFIKEKPEHCESEFEVDPIKIIRTDDVVKMARKYNMVHSLAELLRALPDEIALSETDRWVVGADDELFGLLIMFGQKKLAYHIGYPFFSS